MIEEWKKDMKYIHFSYNLYIEPKFQILEVKSILKSDFPDCNLHGFWAYEKNKIVYIWVDFEIFTTKSMSIYIKMAFNHDKQRWLNNKRKEKLKILETL